MFDFSKSFSQMHMEGYLGEEEKKQLISRKTVEEYP